MTATGVPLPSLQLSALQIKVISRVHVDLFHALAKNLAFEVHSCTFSSAIIIRSGFYYLEVIMPYC